MTRRHVEQLHGSRPPAIVVGVPPCDGGNPAAAYAALVAASRPGTPLVLVNVIGHHEGAEAVPGEVLLQQAQEHVLAISPGLDVRQRLTHGDPSRELIAAAADAAMLVLGRNALAGLSHVLLGTTTTRVLSRVKIPFVSVPVSWTHVDHVPSIAVGLAERDGEAMLQWVCEFAALTGDAVLAVRAVDTPDLSVGPFGGVHDGLVELDTALQATLAACQAQCGVPLDGLLAVGRPEEALIRESRSASLVVVGAGRRGRDKRGLSQVARAVLTQAAGPVCVVPSAALGDLSVARSSEGATAQALPYLAAPPRQRFVKA